MSSGEVSLERFETIAWRYPKIGKLSSGIQLDQFPQCHSSDRRKTPTRSGLVQPLCLVILEGRDHRRGSF
jgi:hypothetical protein